MTRAGSQKFLRIFWLLALFISGLAAAPIPAAPQRIISLKPNVTEMLFALDLRERVVGVTTFCDYPPEARRTAKIGGYINPSLEAILALKPDLVVGETTGLGEQIKRLQEMHVATVMLDFKTLAQIEASMRRLGEITGVPEAGVQMAEKFRADLDRFKDEKHARQPKVLVVVGRDPLFAVGPGTYLDELIARAGGVNVLHDAASTYTQINAEVVIVKAPDVIVDLSMGSEASADRRASALAYWQRFASVPAVKRRQIHFLDQNLLLRPGPRLGLGLEILHAALWP